jgi:nucleolar protein 14
MTLLTSYGFGRVKLIAPKEFNPRYEADFSQHTDYDPDRQRAAARKLQRQVVKESRGAMRELRRDAVFMAAVSATCRCTADAY